MRHVEVFMSIFELLKNGKGTISSALGKELAKRVLDGEHVVLEEALKLCIYDLPTPSSKSIRAGAAKTVEIVAEKAPDLVAPHLESLLEALSAPEPQTRWMILRTCGLCAALAPEIAARAIAYAEAEIERKEGLIIASSADLYLGDLGAVSQDYAAIVFPLLKKSADSAIKNESDWLLEAFTAISANMDDAQKDFAVNFAHRNIESSRKATVARAKKLLKRLGC